MVQEKTAVCCSQSSQCCPASSIMHNDLNTLTYDPARCANCGLCSIVCPHGVFEAGPQAARLVRAEGCMECGACQRNCPTGAIAVDSGVGCAAAMIQAALTGKQEATCGPDSDACCG